MLKHIIFWKLKEGEDANKCADILNPMFNRIIGEVKGLVWAEVGVNVNGGDYDLILYTEFETAEDEKNYQTHPKHLEIKEIVHKMVCDRICCDYLLY
ncbi:MAG: Dabb family protein [Ruminococcaceae bacterium]|nr:Dabb family protein [Oscillospiraceae bacterium]